MGYMDIYGTCLSKASEKLTHTILLLKIGDNFGDPSGSMGP